MKGFNNPEMKNAVSEIKYKLDVINSRLDTQD